jgi:DNA-binding PadR family transcriptional regulator
MRRKPGQLVALEVDILTAALDLRGSSNGRFYGFQIAKVLACESGAQGLTAHGTLYKALSRLETAGLLSSDWEDASVAAAQGRPRRRLYEVTGAAETVLATQRRTVVDPPMGGRPAWGLS